MTAPIRLTVVMTHPVQYYAPWFRHIAANCPEIDLTVLYATEPTPEQQGTGFGRPFTWDIPLTEGYRSRVVRAARPGDNVHSDRFWGLDVPEIGAAIRRSRPDVALIAGWHSVTFLRALWACRRGRIPAVYRGDTHLGNAPGGWRRPLWEAKTRALLGLFDGYLSVGRRTREYLSHFGASETRIFDSPHCVDNDFFASSAAPHRAPEGRAAARASFGLASEDFVVLFAGKLESKKRPLDLVRAVARLGPAASLLAVGAGELQGECRAEARRLGVRAAWPGFLNQSEIGRAYAVADCLALPSDWGETWGLVVNEAMATGLPCVVSDRVGSAPDLVTPGETGGVFPMGDVDALTRALERIRERPEAGHDFAPACRARAEAYSFEAATTGLLAACRAVTVGGRQRSVVKRRRRAPRVVACCGGMVIVFGCERMTFETLRVLRERGAAVHCIVNSWENHRIVALAERIGASWSVGRYRCRFDRHTRSPVKLARFAWDIMLTSSGLLRDALRLRATHVFLPDFTAALRNAPALMALRVTGLPVVLQLQNAPDQGAFYRRLWRHVLNRLVDHFVCNSRFTRNELLAHRISPRKTLRIYNTIPTRPEPDAQEITRDPRKVTYVGQINPEKGVDLLLDAVGLLAGRGHDVKLDVIGPMDGWVPPKYRGYRESLLARARKADLDGRVRFLGVREDVPALLASAGVHCCPSRPEQREAFGVVNVEAKCAGIPSVVTPTGALPELFSHGEDGWISAEVSAAALAEGIEYFLADPARRERAGRAARRSAERFSRERFADAWWSVFQLTDR